jgi:large subunit ribosomal protein L29
MSVEEMTAREGELRKSLFNMRSRAHTKQLENVSQIKQEKKELARLLTVMAQKRKSA